MMDITEVRKNLKRKELSYNIAKLELRVMEMDEEKSKIQETIDRQSDELKNLGGN